MKRISFVTYHKMPNLTADDALAIEPLKRFDIKVIPAIWDSAGVDWTQFDAVIVRSCWDYHHKPREFRRWINHLQEINATLWNPAEIIRWNMNKKYLQDLAARGAAIPSTVWVEMESAADLRALLENNGFEHAVIKPTISATAWQTRRTSLATAQHDQSHLDEILRGSDAMIQKFVDEVTITGECSLIFWAANLRLLNWKRSSRICFCNWIPPRRNVSRKQL